MEERRSLGGEPKRKRAGKGEAGEGEISHPLSLSLGLSHTETAGDCRVAINAVELTPGCPFAGKVRLKERRNGRQLPRNERESAGAEGHASMSITPGLQSPLFCCSLCLPFGVAQTFASCSSSSRH